MYCEPESKTEESAVQEIRTLGSGVTDRPNLLEANACALLDTGFPKPNRPIAKSLPGAGQ